MLKSIDRILAPVTWFIAGFAVVALLVGPEMIGAKVSKPAPPAAATPTPAADADATPGAAPTAAPTTDTAAAGEAVFTSTCGGCHTLSAAGTSGAVGPNLDEVKPDAATVTTIVTEGRGGMPSFEGDLTPEEIDAVAAYVSSVAGS